MRGFAIFALALVCPAASAQANEAEDVVGRMVSAYDKFDFRAFLAEFADDVDISTSDGSQHYKGKTALRKLYSTNFSQRWPVVRIVSRETQGNRVILVEAYPRDDQEICCTKTEYTVEDGKIQSLVLTLPKDFSGA